jgi:hypothetical protein
MPTPFGFRMIFVTCGQPWAPCSWSTPSHGHMDSSATSFQLARNPPLRLVLNASMSGCIRRPRRGPPRQRGSTSGSRSSSPGSAAASSSTGSNAPSSNSSSVQSPPTSQQQPRHARARARARARAHVRAHVRGRGHVRAHGRLRQPHQRSSPAIFARTRADTQTAASSPSHLTQRERASASPVIRLPRAPSPTFRGGVAWPNHRL